MNQAFAPSGNSQLVALTTTGSTGVSVGSQAVRLRVSAASFVAFGSSTVAASFPTTGVPANGISLPAGAVEVFGAGPNTYISFISSGTVGITAVITPGSQKGVFTPQGLSQAVAVTTTASTAVQLTGGTQGVRFRNTSAAFQVYAAIGTSTVTAVVGSTAAAFSGFVISLLSFEKMSVPPNCYVSFISSAAGPTIYVTQGVGK